MSQTDPAQTDSQQKFSHPAPEEQFKQSMQVFGNLFERITPWLVEFGSWIFGGLIAFILLIMVPLITIASGQPAITVSITAFALALPLDVAGLILLRLLQDMTHIGFEEEVAHVFQEVGFTVEEQFASPKALESRKKKRTGTILTFCFGILTLSLLLALTGTIAALWHVAWWIGVAFLAMVLLSQGMVVAAFGTLEPPNSQGQKGRRRRSPEEWIRQATEQARKNEEKA